jgi:hypothetical protein
MKEQLQISRRSALKIFGAIIGGTGLGFVIHDFYRSSEQAITYRSIDNAGNGATSATNIPTETTPTHTLTPITTEESKPSTFQSSSDIPFVPEIGTEHFKEECKKDPTISETYKLMGMINAYINTTTPDDVKDHKKPCLGTYLRETEWYEKKKQTLTEEQLSLLNAILRVTDGYTFQHANPNSTTLLPFDCLGWTRLLSGLGYPVSPVNAGGVQKEGNTISEQTIHFAKELVPYEITNSHTQSTFLYYDKVRKLFFKVGLYLSASDVEVGSLFVRYDGYTGHIGAVIGSKEVNGNTTLLVTDANKQKDGRVHIFEVTDKNINSIFGAPPYKKVLIINPRFH